MIRAEARRRRGGEVPEPDGPDPAEDPILYLEDDQKEGGEDR